MVSFVLLAEMFIFVSLRNVKVHPIQKINKSDINNFFMDLLKHVILKCFLNLLSFKIKLKLYVLKNTVK